MTTIYLIRHAEAEGNIYRRCHGWYNSLITLNGYRQIEALRRRFEEIPVDAVYSSDLFRTMTTASAVYKPKKLTLQTDPGLREIGCGVWEDSTWGELLRNEPASLEAFNRSDPAWRVEGGETYEGLQERMVRTLRRIAAENEGKTVAVVSHGTAIRAALAWARGLPLSRLDRVPYGDNTAVSQLAFHPDRVEIVFANDNSHLGEELSTLGRQTWWKKNGMTNYAQANLWFRPLDFATEAGFYRKARREAWETIHGTLRGFQGDAFLADAERCAGYDPAAVKVAMRGDERAGIIQLDAQRDSELGVGRIPFFYMTPAARTQGLGVQLLGEAVSFFRPLDRQFLRLRCAPENERARRFYERHGFYKVAEEPGGLGTLDVLEKFIGYELNGPAGSQAP